MSDIVERLTDYARGGSGPISMDCAKAATAIRNYRTEIEALKHDIERHLNITSEQATEVERLRSQVERQSVALSTIVDIAEGSRTLNSFPNIAKIAREAAL